MTKYDKAYEEYFHVLDMWANKMRRDLDYDDTLQELGIVLMRCVDNFKEGKASLRTYIWRSCQHKVGELAKKAQLKYMSSLDEEGAYGTKLDEVGFDERKLERLNEREKFLTLTLELNKLKYGHFSTMHILFDMTYQQIADYEGCSKQFVGKMHKKNMAYLKKEIENGLL